jgi:dihydrofolate synthase / folylpolyglutamate synthase
MQYEECLAYLNRLGNEVLSMKLGLETIRRVLDGMERPDRSYASVLVAGTNGKGSVSRFLAAIAADSGVRTGLFTSPHLVRLTERIRINGEPIPPALFARHLTRVVETIRRLNLPSHPTFFETVTATALASYAEEGVELAVLEIGMGGRLDSTNVVDPVLSVITPVNLDHEQYLGPTLGKIAREKAGIMRAGTLTLSSPQAPEVSEALAAVAREVGARLEFVAPPPSEMIHPDAGRYSFVLAKERYHLRAHGEFQVANATLALRAAEELSRLGFPVTDQARRSGIEDTLIDGVLQFVRESPPLLLDGGHNPAAALALAHFLERHTPSPRHLVFGIMGDKDVKGVLSHLDPCFDRIFLTRVESPRAAGIEELRTLCPRGIALGDPLAALTEAQSRPGTVVVAGSFYLVGLILGSALGASPARRSPFGWRPPAARPRLDY